MVITQWRRTKMSDRSARFFRVNILSVLVALSLIAGAAWADFATVLDGTGRHARYTPYLQHPRVDGMTVMWFSDENQPGTLTVESDGKRPVLRSQPVAAPAVSAGWSEKWRPDKAVPRYLHEVSVTGLQPDTTYRYRVIQGRAEFASTFRTAPARDTNRRIRLIAIADSETEPDVKRQKVRGKPYPVTEDEGFADNLEAIRSRRPDLLIIAGDLVQHGGEQEDWERFFAHVGGNSPENSLAGRVPIVAALGNREYYGPSYAQPHSERAVAKFLTYFSNPGNGSPHAMQRERYYRLDYGPIAILVLDCNNGPDNDPDRDTNQKGLIGENHPGGTAPNWAPGSRQYQWLVKQLQDAQKRMAFTFVVHHYCPFSSGPHGQPPGNGKGRDGLSGIALRELDPLFHQYGVQMVLSGHDEMLELSATQSQAGLHTVYYWDVGIAGDGLRPPTPGVVNPAQLFIAHGSPQGKHYGFLQIDLEQRAGRWAATVQPHWIDPVKREIGGAYDIKLHINGRPLQ